MLGCVAERDPAAVRVAEEVEPPQTQLIDLRRKIVGVAAHAQRRGPAGHSPQPQPGAWR